MSFSMGESRPDLEIGSHGAEIRLDEDGEDEEADDELDGFVEEDGDRGQIHAHFSHISDPRVAHQEGHDGALDCEEEEGEGFQAPCSLSHFETISATPPMPFHP